MLYYKLMRSKYSPRREYILEVTTGKETSRQRKKSDRKAKCDKIHENNLYVIFDTVGQKK